MAVLSWTQHVFCNIEKKTFNIKKCAKQSRQPKLAIFTVILRLDTKLSKHNQSDANNAAHINVMFFVHNTIKARMCCLAYLQTYCEINV